MRLFPRFIFCLLFLAGISLDPPAGTAQSKGPIARAPAHAFVASADQRAQQPASGRAADAVPESGDPQQHPSTPDESLASLHGTVTDVYGDLIPGATVVITDAAGQSNTVVADTNAAFLFGHIKPGIVHHVNVIAKGFETWNSPALILKPIPPR